MRICRTTTWSQVGAPFLAPAYVAGVGMPSAVNAAATARRVCPAPWVADPEQQPVDRPRALLGKLDTLQCYPCRRSGQQQPVSLIARGFFHALKERAAAGVSVSLSLSQPSDRGWEWEGSMSTRPQKQISCKKHANVDKWCNCLRWHALSELHLASLPQLLCLGRVNH